MKRDLHRVLLLGAGCKTAPRPGVIVLTPNPRAARTMGVPHQPLEKLARKTLQNAGLGVASVLIAHRTLHKAVHEVLQTGETRPMSKGAGGAHG